MTLEIKDIISILAVFASSIISILAYRRAVKKDQKDELDKHISEIDGTLDKKRDDIFELETRLRALIAEHHLLVIERLTRVETQQELQVKMIERTGFKVLHDPHPEAARKDALLEKYRDHVKSGKEMQREEIQELADFLVKITDSSEETPGRRVIASQFLWAMKIRYPNIVKL